MQTNNPKYILVHCSDIDSKLVADQFTGVNRTHRDERNFNTSSLGFNVGYHVFVTGGVAYRARVDTEYGNHCNNLVDGLSMNFQSLGICFGIDGDIELPSQGMVNLARAQILEWQRLYNIPNERVLFHRDFSKTKSCPGSLISRGWLEENILEMPKPPVVEVKEEIKEEVKEEVKEKITDKKSLWTKILNVIKLLLCIKQ